MAKTTWAAASLGLRSERKVQAAAAAMAAVVAIVLARSDPIRYLKFVETMESKMR